jgi:hypothetical protein
MPEYPTLGSVPPSKAVQSWKAFTNALKGVPELAFFENRVIRHDVPTLPPEASPLLVVVKYGDAFKRGGVGNNPPYRVWWDYAVRVYLYNDSANVTEYEALCDKLEDINEVVVRTLRSPYMACQNPYWLELDISADGNERTSLIGSVKERLYITTRFRIARDFRPGQ